MPLRDSLPLVSSALGFIAVVCVLAIGGYAVAWCLNTYFSGIGPSFLTIGVASWVLILTAVLLLGYGSLKTIKKPTRKNGLLNLTAGIITIPMFIYFNNIIHLFPQFGFLGFLLFLPAMLSGIISLASPKHPKT